MNWEEAKHPRAPKGTTGGGKFTSVGAGFAKDKTFMTEKDLKKLSTKRRARNARDPAYQAFIRARTLRALGGG